ncbi:MAG: flagellar hook-basal body complex protein FliE [Roseibium album]|uniref:Flagellar hook-basal body complex protein FliE n=2 Tax=Stappiaceae TaxID=2821832 RepID=A0A0M6ZB53_9HYPH|nr:MULTISPECIES: flagellar hook-basal body complex protein FliE [Stappiaceae]MBG6143154.1 flagellar hook-basal body complex protein FliE [Labrenzia sp. EL_142]MBG6157108.1 flagellar hook-basal body complex protein FliE [Labrenzia sp. EL_162]MBG6166443.1 flagellar hook-basal body complex protein FliE [Labrenzia sp. EL_195]MBG6172358.1 flagellar hook-basal body complex protein FliE [Labrenzia sp. EL_132]MBG6194950.1 flagellar hook-basal body complex protein FliE [Labrenzia sp. EL_159]MBG6203469
MTTPSIANNAYQIAAKLQQQARAVEETVPDRSAVDFGQMVQEAVETVVDKGQQTDNMAIGMIEGKTGVVDVVTAVAETELALETMVAVRDRVISAYEEIMRMPI